MKYLIPVITIALLTSCGGQPTSTENAEASEDATVANVGWFGEEFEMAEATAASDVSSLMNDSSVNEFIVSGTIEEVCQKKGCWMKVATAEDESMRISFKDYGFFVPLDASGKTMTMKGVAGFDTIDVDMLKHFAEDAGQSQEEIDAITEPEFALTFEATGVLIQ